MNQHLVFGPAPSRTEFPDATTALKYLEEYSRPLGFCVVIRSSEKNTSGQHFRSYYWCDRGTKYTDRTTPCAKSRKKRTEEGIVSTWHGLTEDELPFSVAVATQRRRNMAPLLQPAFSQSPSFSQRFRPSYTTKTRP